MTIPDNDPLSAACYVLGLTDDLTRQKLDERLIADPDFAAEVMRWQKAFSVADVTTEDLIPSSSLWPQIEREINRTSITARSSSAHLRPVHWAGWAVAAALAGIVIFTDVMKPEISNESRLVAVLKGPQADAQFVISMDKSGSFIRVSSLGVTLPVNKSLQLWMIKGNSAPHSLGIISHSDINIYRLPSGGMDNQTVFAISLEPIGGSETAGPSGSVIFQGKFISF